MPPDAQETIQPGTAIGAIEVLTRQCLFCQKVFPAQGHFCPACGHPVGQLAALSKVNNAQAVTFTVATTQLERADVGAVRATLSAQQADPNAPGTTAEQPEAAPHLPGVAESRRHFPEESAPETRPGEDKERKEEQEEKEEGPVATFLERQIDFKKLSRPFQLLLALTLAQIAVVALLLATQNLPQPLVSSGVNAEGQSYVVPLAAFIVLAVSLAAGTWFALAGALRVHWSVRFLVVALAIAMLAFYPVFQLMNNRGPQGEPFLTEVRVRWIQLGLLALFWIWVVCASLLRWRAQRKGTVLPPNARLWHRWTFWLAVVPILIYYGLDLLIWRAYVSAGLPGQGSALFLGSIGFQSILLPAFLLLLVYWSSTDLLEWSEIIAKSVVAATRPVRIPLLLFTVTALAAAAMLVNEVRINGWKILPGMALLAVLIALVALIVRFARIRSDWPAQIPPLGLLLGSIVLYLQFAVTYEVIVPLAATRGLSLGVLEPLLLLMAVPVLLVALTTGLVLVARGRLGKPNQGAVGLFLVMVTLLTLTASLPAILSAAGFSVAFLQQPLALLGGLKFLAAGGALIWISYLLVRRRPLKKAARMLSFLFLLLAGLQAIDWLDDLANGISALGARSTVLLAGLFVLTALWDLVTSGEQVTNKNSPAFPREGRILLYVGSTLVATSLLLYIGSLRAQTTGAPAPDYFSTDNDAFLGLFLLGTPMVVLTFLLSVGRRIPRSTVAVVPQPVRRFSARSTQLGIVGSGVLALALFMSFFIGSALPRLVHTNQAPQGGSTYTAKSPGPGCDTGGATWSVQPDAPISLRCLPVGTQITALPKKPGYVGFLPPGSTLVWDYRVSVNIDFSNAPHTCIGILTRFSGISYYGSAICADGAWILWRDLDKITTLAQGHVALARTYTLGAETDGPKQSLTISGIKKASVTDGALTTGYIELEVFNADSIPKSVVLSGFSYTALPTSTSIAAPFITIPSSAVLLSGIR